MVPDHNVVDLTFPLVATRSIPADHGYLLYSAISRLEQAVHESNGLAILPISGTQLGNRRLRLTDRSRLVMRAEAHRISFLTKLAGKKLDLAGTPVQIGVPRIGALLPNARLRSRLVVIKITGLASPAAMTAEDFSAAVRRQLDGLGISAAAGIKIGKRRTLRIHRREIVGYEVIIDGLSDEESLRLQSHGIGGRHHMGCGIFVPLR